MTSELPWMNKILKHVKNECNKVRSIQHILSRKKSNYVAKPPRDVEGLKWGTIFSNHMLNIEYDEKYGGWQRPAVTPFENISLHPASKVLQYAISIFEGMKAHRGVDGKIRLFRPELNVRRFNATAEKACLPPIDPAFLMKSLENLIRIDQEWVPYSPTGSLYIRPTMIGMDPTLGVGWCTKALLYVFLSPTGSYFGSGMKAIRLFADPRYVRAWPGGCGDAKMGSNYAPCTRIQKLAVDSGCHQVLWLFGKDEQITEAGTMNVFMIYINDSGELEMVTPPLNGLILPGIMRLSLMEVAKEWNEFKVVERNVTMNELVKLNGENRLLELFGSGTACAVTPISEIQYKGQLLKIPTMVGRNPVHERLLNEIIAIQYGKKPHAWAPVLNVDFQTSQQMLAVQ